MGYIIIHGRLILLTVYHFDDLLQAQQTALHISCKRHAPSVTYKLVQCEGCELYKMDKVSQLIKLYWT